MRYWAEILFKLLNGSYGMTTLVLRPLLVGQPLATKEL